MLGDAQLFARVTEAMASPFLNEGVTHVVASSFLYERIARGAALTPGADGLVHEYAEKYRRLFARPYTEIPPAYMSFAFSDPTIRIVDIREADEPAVSR